MDTARACLTVDELSVLSSFFVIPSTRSRDWEDEAEQPPVHHQLPDEEAVGGWTDDLTLALIKILCTHCWESARARNERIPPLARGKAVQLSKDEQRQIAGATQQLNRVQEAADTKWRFLTFPRWDFDSDNRTVTFSERESRRLIANVRMVGSYSKFVPVGVGALRSR